MTRVVTFASQKGGVAKTTSAANVAVAWGELGLKSLLIDLDPGFSLTRLCGRAPSQAPATIFDVLNGDEDIRPRVINGVRSCMQRLDPTTAIDARCKLRSSLRVKGTQQSPQVGAGRSSRTSEAGRGVRRLLWYRTYVRYSKKHQAPLASQGWAGGSAEP